MAILDNIIVFLIIMLIILLIWSRVMGQRVLDSLNEVKEFLRSLSPEQQIP